MDQLQRLFGPSLGSGGYRLRLALRRRRYHLVTPDTQWPPPAPIASGRRPLPPADGRGGAGEELFACWAALPDGAEVAVLLGLHQRLARSVAR